jgi:hypothetical protein
MATQVAQETRPSGHLQVKGEQGRRTWYALWRDADGRHQKRLGLAHVKGLWPAHTARRRRLAGGRRAQARRELPLPC